MGGGLRLAVDCNRLVMMMIQTYKQMLLLYNISISIDMVLMLNLLSPRHRRRTPVTNSGESSTEGDSSHQSQRSVVYLHATTGKFIVILSPALIAIHLGP